VTPFRGGKVKGQRSRSPGRLTPRPKITHIFRMERPTNFKLGTRMEYDDPHHSVRGDLKLKAVRGCSSHHLQGRGILWRPHYRYGLAVWCSGNALVSINAVALHRARLILGWVTALIRAGELSHYVTSHPGQLSLSSFRGR